MSITRIGRVGSTAYLSNVNGPIQQALNALTAQATAGLVCTVTLAAPGEGYCWVLAGYTASMNSDPAAAVTVTVTSNSTIKHRDKITKAGPAPVTFPERIFLEENMAATVTVSAPGAAITTDLNVFAKIEDIAER